MTSLLLEVHRSLGCLGMGNHLRCLLGLCLHLSRESSVFSSLSEKKSRFYLSSYLGLLLGHQRLVPCRVSRRQELIRRQTRHILSYIGLAKGHSQ